MQRVIQIINPVSEPRWNERVLINKKCSFFHTANWAQVLAEAYQYTPLYFTVIENDKLTALVPCIEVRSALTGRRGVSLPFTDACDTVTGNGVQFRELLDEVLAYGGNAGWKYFEMRPEAPLPEPYMPSSSYFEHLLDICPDEERIVARMRNSTWRNIKKGESSGIGVEIGSSNRFLAEFYRLNCLTRRDHGLPPQPYVFFQKIHEHVLSKGLGIVILAFHHGRAIAGSIYFHFGEKALYKYGASDREHQHLRANNLVMWQAIRWYKRQGCRTLSFGRTELENTGLLQFKRGWGAVERPLHYYKYDFQKKDFIAERPKVTGAHNRYFRMMPISLLKIAGSLLYRHVG